MDLEVPDAQPQGDSSRSLPLEQYTKEEKEQQILRFSDPNATVEERRGVLQWLWNYYKAIGRPQAFEHVVRMEYMGSLVFNGSCVLVLLSADRARFYAMSKIQFYMQLHKDYRRLLKKLKKLPNSTTGELGAFISLLEQCLTSTGGRVMTAPRYADIILNGPSMGEVPEDLVEELLELALAREDKEGYAAGLADHREYMVFIKDPRLATVAADEAFIRPFARDVIITLGVVMYAFVTGQAALGGRVLRIVETAALRADTYYDLMPRELRAAAVGSLLATARGSLTPNDYVAQLLGNILSGDVALKLPDEEDKVGQSRLQEQVEQALKAWVDLNAAKAAAGASRTGATSSGSSSLDVQPHAAAAGSSGAGQALSGLLMSMPDATSATALQVIAQMRRKEQQRAEKQQEKVSMRQATAGLLQQLLRLAVSTPAAEGGGGAAAGQGGGPEAVEGAGGPGAEPMDVEG